MNAPSATSIQASGTDRIKQWRPSAAQRSLLVGVTYAALTTLCVVGAYWAMFSIFQVYDDEGFFDYSLNLFRDGHPLYTAVFSHYGPFYYESFGALSKLLGHAATTDAGRLIALTLWVGSSLGIGLAAQRLSGRVTLGIAALAATFSVLFVMRNEPMHASGLIAALLTGLALVIAYGVPRFERSSLFAIGAIGAALLLTKINVGGYALIGIAFALVLASPRLRRIGPLRWGAIAVFVLVGPAVMISKVNTPWGRDYIALALLSAGAIAVVAEAITDPDERGAGPSSPVWPIAGFAALAIVVLAIAIALGSRVPDLADQLIAVPARQGSILTYPVVLSSRVLWWSLGSIVLAWIAAQLLRHPSDEPQRLLYDGVLRTVAGIAILFSLQSAYPFAVGHDALFALAMPLTWVAALPSRRDRGPRHRLVRLMVPAVAVLQGLQAYPVAGSQVGFGSMLFVLCGAICIADGCTELLAWSALRPARVAVTTASIAALLAAIAAGGVWQEVVQPLGPYRDAYRGGVSLRVAGATRLHVYSGLAAELEGTVLMLRSRCRAVISYPGMYSLNLWSGLPTPSPLTGEQPFWRVLSAGQQQQVLAAAKATPGLCEVRNAQLLSFYGGPPKAQSPLITYLDDAFTPIGQFGSYVVEARQ